MSNLTTFIDAYQKTGNEISLHEVMIDDSNVASYAAGLKGIPVPAPAPTMAPEGETVSAASKKSPGTPYQDKNGKVNFFTIDGAGRFPNGNSYFTTDLTGWQTVADYYNKQSDVINSEEDADTNKKREPQTGNDLTGPAEENEKALRAAAQQIGTEIDEACGKVSDKVDAKLNTDGLPEGAVEITGCERQRDGGKGANTAFLNQLVGLGRDGRNRRLAQEAGDTAQERIENATEIKNQIVSLFGIAGKMLKDNFNLQQLDTSEMELLSCLKLRGTGQTRGVWISGGGGCEGAIAALATGDGVSGDERYGVQLGNQNSPLYRAMLASRQQEIMIPDGKDEKGEEKQRNVIQLGTEDNGLAAFYNATFGRINEKAVNLSYCMEGDTGRSEAENTECIKDAVLDMAREMGGSNGISKLCSFLGDKLEDPESQFDFGTLVDKGAFNTAEEIYNHAQENNIDLGQDRDCANKVIPYMMAKTVQRQKAFAQSLPKGATIEGVGTTRAGVDADNNIDNADIIIKLPGGTAADEKYLDSLTVNPLFTVTDEKCQGRDDGQGVGVSMKEKTSANKAMAAGSRSVRRMTGGDGREAGARENLKCYARNVCENHKKAGKDCGLEEGWEEAEADYREERDTYVNESVEKILAMDSATLKQIRQDQMAKMTYADGESQKDFWNLVDNVKQSQGTPQETNLVEKLRNRIMIGKMKRDFDNDKPGVRETMMIDALYTGGSTRDQAFLQTSEGAPARAARESDIIGTAAFSLLKKDQEINFTSQSFNAVGIGRFVVRVKGANTDGTGGTNKAFFNIDPNHVEENTKELTPKESKAVGNSAMKAEDFVRQLQELIKGIDKILPVQD